MALIHKSRQDIGVIQETSEKTVYNALLEDDLPVLLFGIKVSKGCYQY
jgi:hypothetical protein